MKKLILILSLLASAPSIAGYSVIVHPSNSATIDMDDVKNIFMGKKGSFDDGSSAIPVNYTQGHPARTAMVGNVVSRSPSQYVSHWAKMVFTGAATPPKEISEPSEMKSLVSSNPNLIGYIDDSLVDDSVKVVGNF